MKQNVIILVVFAVVFQACSVVATVLLVQNMQLIIDNGLNWFATTTPFYVIVAMGIVAAFCAVPIILMVSRLLDYFKTK